MKHCSCHFLPLPERLIRVLCINSALTTTLRGRGLLSSFLLRNICFRSQKTEDMRERERRERKKETEGVGGRKGGRGREGGRERHPVPSDTDGQQ
jgi:hypothetical protein